jgi:hypothetical protein
MHKVLFSTGLAVLALVVVASGANGAGPGFEMVSGAGVSESQGLIQVSAATRDDPLEPSGHFVIADAEAEGEVTCLTVFPTGAARIGGVDRRDGTAYLIFIVENSGAANEADAHQWRQAQPFEVDEGGCSDFSGFGHTLNPVPITSGNYTTTPG